MKNYKVHQPLTAPTSYAEFLQVANAFLFVRFARNILHLPFSLVHLIKFGAARQFSASKSAQLVAANRYAQCKATVQH